MLHTKFFFLFFFWIFRSFFILLNHHWKRLLVLFIFLCLPFYPIQFLLCDPLIYFFLLCFVCLFEHFSFLFHFKIEVSYLEWKSCGTWNVWPKMSFDTFRTKKKNGIAKLVLIKWLILCCRLWQFPEWNLFYLN